MTPLTIKTADGTSFEVDFDVARQSQTIKTMLDDINVDESSDGEKLLPLTNEEVTGPVFKKALVWMTENRGKPEPKEDDDEDELKTKPCVSLDQLNDWEKKYIDMPVDEMFPLLITGNFLEIKGLINLMVKAVALQIQGKTVEQIRETFHIADPCWTPEELQKLKEENAWAYETKK